MNEEGLEQKRRNDTNAFAAALAMSGGALDPRAAEYLEKQSRLAELQIEDMEREDRLRHWSLRFANLSAVMKAGFEIAVAFLFLAIAAGLGAAIWSAVHDNSVVIEAFSVPPDMAARGLTGQAIASQLDDKLAAMQDETDSARPANSYVNKWGDDIKVQIPDTGIAIGEFYRSLASWLGSQTRMSGEVYRSQNGVAITVRAGSGGGTTVSGTEKDFDALVQKAAEAIYARTQPYRYAIFLIGRTAPDVRRQMLLRLLREGETTTDRVWALNGLGSLDAAGFADLYAAVAEYRKAVGIKPDFVLAWSNIGEYETTLGHDESALDAYRRSLPLFASGTQITERSAHLLLPGVKASIARDLGDFETAHALYQRAAQLPDYSNTVEQALDDDIIMLARMHDARGAFSELNAITPTADPILLASRAISRFWVYWASQEWPSVERQQIDVERALSTAGLNSGIDGNAFVVVRARQVWPASAYASAATGNFATAHALIDKTPLDCYLCVRMRGNIEAAAKNWPGAEQWFAEAVRQGPSIPFAYSDWGAMLLHEGRYDAAIAKFREANRKGPHFADPIEMWGEALMQKNRSDFALAKFEEANKYASHWGRLHLEWGKALVYAGRKDEAKRQFAQATSLDLSVSDKTSLANWTAPHA